MNLSLRTCDSRLSGRTLVQENGPMSPAAPTGNYTERPSGSPKQLLASDKQLDAVQVSEALTLVAQWMTEQGYMLPIKEPQYNVPSTPAQLNINGSNQTLISKGTSRIKTWVKGSKNGPVFRVRRRTDNGHDEITDLQFKSEQMFDRKAKQNPTKFLPFSTPMPSEMEAKEQEIQEMPVEISEFPSEPIEFPSYSSTSLTTEELTWQSVEVPAITGAPEHVAGSSSTMALLGSTTNTDLEVTSASYNGVTRLRSTAALLHKLKAERERLWVPCVKHTGVAPQQSILDREESLCDTCATRRGNNDSTMDPSVQEDENASVTSTTTPTHTLVKEVQQIDRERTLAIEKLWRALLLQQIHILGEGHRLIKKAHKDFALSQNKGHRDVSLTKSLRRSHFLATRRIGLIHPLLVRFVGDLSNLESLLRRYTAEDDDPAADEITNVTQSHKDISAVSEDSLIEDIAANSSVKEPVASAPVTPIDRDSNLDIKTAIGSELEDAPLSTILGHRSRSDVRVRLSRSLPSLRMPPSTVTFHRERKEGFKHSDLGGETLSPSQPSQAYLGEISLRSTDQYDSQGTSRSIIAPAVIVTDLSEPDHAQVHEITGIGSRVESNCIYPAETASKSQAWNDNPPRMKIFCQLILNRIIETIREGTASLQRALGTEPIPHDHVRVHWRCACGEHLHDDFMELRAGAADELEAQLNGGRTHTYSNTPSPTSSISSSSGGGNSTFSSPGTLSPSSATTWSTNASAGNSPSGQKGPAALPSPISPCLVSIPERKPPWLLVCANEGRFTPKLTHLDVGTDKISNDKDLALALRTHYFGLNSKWYHYLRLRGLTQIDFVRFQHHINRFADIRARPSMPPTTNRSYTFLPDLIPPVGSTYLLHLLHHPQDYENEHIAYDRMPKLVSGRLGPGDCGWGVELVETFLADRVWGIVLVVFGLGSLVFGSVWAATKRDLQGAFGIAAWVCGLAVLLTGWLQACLG